MLAVPRHFNATGARKYKIVGKIETPEINSIRSVKRYTRLYKIKNIRKALNIYLGSGRTTLPVA
jgi:hypothetical protein